MNFVRHLMPAGAVLCAALGLASLVQAQGTRAVRDAMPGVKFNKDDQALMMARVKEALAADKDGDTLDWKSDKTPAAGSVTALARYQADGQACRRLRIHNAYGDVKAQGVYKFCQQADRSWKLIGADQ